MKEQIKKIRKAIAEWGRDLEEEKPIDNDFDHVVRINQFLKIANHHGVLGYPTPPKDILNLTKACLAWLESKND